tara:strand:+ start:5568 stop:5900 length:333 start_codon:yes stop_codon:yes gene_type:complete
MKYASDRAFVKVFVESVLVIRCSIVAVMTSPADQRELVNPSVEVADGVDPVAYQSPDANLPRFAVTILKSDSSVLVVVFLTVNLATILKVEPEFKDTPLKDAKFDIVTII